MNISIKLNLIRITDENTGQSIIIKTVRSLNEIVVDTHELEKDAFRDKIEETLAEAYAQPEA